MSAAVRIIPEGADVYTADGEKVGRAREHEADYLHVQHGRLFGADDDYYFPAHTIARVDEAAGRVELALTQAEVDARDWSVPPPPSTAPERPVAGAASPVAAASPAVGGGDRDEVVVPVTAERLEVEKRPVALGEVVLRKRVIVERRMVPVELRREVIRVERPGAQDEELPAGWAPGPGEEIIHEEAIRFPLRGEEPAVTKRAVVTEEIVLTKEATTERRMVSGAVRREEVAVDRAGERAGQPATDTPVAARSAASPAAGRASGEVRPDMAVIGADGRPIGRVKEVQAGNILVDRPRQRDVYVPRAAVRDLTAGEVLLNVPADQVGAMGWEQPPPA